MSELTVIDSNNYAAVAQMLGMSSDTNDNTSTLARIKIHSQPIKGKAEVNGKMMNVDIVSAGSFFMADVEGKTIYAEKIKMRMFMQRFMYQKYDPNAKNYVKTVMSENLKIDLKDNYGGFNCGKPSGYIKDFDALSKDKQDLIRSIKRTRSTYGTVTFIDAKDEEGNAAELENVPFVFDISQKEGFKNFADVTAKFAQHRRLPIMHDIIVSTAERTGPNGPYYIPVCEADLNTTHEITDEDQSLLRDFQAVIENHNRWVLSEWEQKNVQKATEEEKELAESFVDIDVEEVE
jgi:hypothetical protein